ncbi:hypothetical protein A8C32_13500 [Flavivirga aquatica]|uniref:Uncharacterized protein n=1 Tax=Flavivirga aquatica TaxID=1849968 RepID=A0A1E5TEC4_9FLAO|nr:hypothetical protein [Flavivirga aquatica]OEK09710.1 hypothetical protein A8C32_13500 [Flavivirga aquatica]
MKYFSFFYYLLPFLVVLKTLIYTIHIKNETKSVAIAYAQKALQQDFNLKFGTTQSSKIPIDIIFKLDENWSEFDKYKIEIISNKITFTGSDELSLIHTIYTFSEDYLEIDPFIYFTDIVPKQSCPK